MPGFLSRLLGGNASAGLTGFSYVPLTDDGPMAQAAPGVVVRTPDAGPPWIVVDHSFESVVVARWPGRLWHVEILRAAAEQPREGAGYTRALAVRVRNELPVTKLFGPHGEDVVRVIETAASLDAGRAAEFGARSTALAREAYARAWRTWIGRMDPGSIHLYADHSDTLAVPIAGMRSPIAGGFMVLHGVVGDRARALAGDSAFIAGEDGDLYLAEPWGKAAGALLHAAMALGAPGLVPEADRAVLTEAWESVG